MAAGPSVSRGARPVESRPRRDDRPIAYPTVGNEAAKQSRILVAYLSHHGTNDIDPALRSRLDCYNRGMSDADPQTSARIAAEAAALAEHLERVGVQFMPTPQPTEVESLRAQLAAAAPAVPAAVVEVAETPGPPAESVAKPTTTPRLPPASKAASPTQSNPVVDAALEAYPGDPLVESERRTRLEVLTAEVAACTRCAALVNCRTNTVFGEGSPTPRVVFFGEGPGADEDRSGRPFVGKAGQLLTKMIEACTFRREDVYILNTVKCRPPNNRNPEADEIEHCREYFENQLSILRPEYIVCLGAISSRALLRSKLSVGRLRGKLHRYFESKVLVTYHPAYLLRTPAAKKAAWDDLQLMLRDAGIKPNA